MRFFNVQNHGLGYNHPVFLNITSADCENLEFREEVGTGGSKEYIITPDKNFLRVNRSLRFINYAYAGGINKCNYDLVKTTADGKVYFTYTLAKAIHPTLPVFKDTPYWDFGHAIFKNGSPVITFQLVFSNGVLESYSFTSLRDMSPDGDLIMFRSEADRLEVKLYPPEQIYNSMGGGRYMTIAMAFGYQNPDTDIYDRAVEGLRYHTNELRDVIRIQPLCWFLENYNGKYMAFKMVQSSDTAWDMNASSQVYSYSVWFSNEASKAYEYLNEAFPGYNGLDM